MSSIVRTAALAILVAITVTVSAAAGPTPALASGAAPPITGVPPGYRPLTIKTLPPIPGVRLSLNAQQLVTGPDGTVRTVITKEDRDMLAADRDAHLRMISTNVNILPGIRGRFYGWYQEGYHYTPQDPSGQIEIATFDVDSYTRFRFVDSQSNFVDTNVITDLQLRNSLGGLVDVGKPKPTWLRSAHVTAVAGNVILKDVEWRLASVTFHGTNIVQRGLQTFTPRETPVVDVRVKLFTVEFRASDAFFGWPKGSSITLTMPDGTVRTGEMRQGRAAFGQLPSGDYDARVNARGLGMDQSVSISSDTPVELKVLSPIDIALALAVLAVFVCGVLLLGRRIRRRRREAAEPGALIQAALP